MTVKSCIHKTSIHLLMLSSVASPVCSAGESGRVPAANPGRCAPQGCADDLLKGSGCGEAGCGEAVDSAGCDYKVLDLHKVFDSVAGGTRHTIGSRVAGKKPVKEGKKLVGTWNRDAEGAFQFGEDNFGSAADRNVQAGVFGALGGYTFEDVTWKPSLSGIFYWGSGDNDPTTGTINTFNTLYPLGHVYRGGQIDNLAGQNLLDYAVQAGLKPYEKFTLVSQWHYFDQATASNVLYNVVGAALPGSGSSNLGNELDIVGTWTYSKAFNLQAGYFWFFYGDAINKGALARPNAEQFYLQATYAF